MNSILLLVATIAFAWILFSFAGWLWVFVSAKMHGTLLKPIEFTEKLEADNGQIIEKGNHNELMKLKRVYYKYVNMQSLEK